MRKRRGVVARIRESPINYFSDLFVVTMVLAWIFVIIVMLVMAVYATFRIEDTSIWSELANLVAIPLSAGGAVWMVKNTVQHNIANKRGEDARQDFPRVPDTEDYDEFEEPMCGNGYSEEEEESMTEEVMKDGAIMYSDPESVDPGEDLSFEGGYLSEEDCEEEEDEDEQADK